MLKEETIDLKINELTKKFMIELNLGAKEIEEEKAGENQNEDSWMNRFQKGLSQPQEDDSDDEFNQIFKSKKAKEEIGDKMPQQNRVQYS